MTCYAQTRLGILVNSICFPFMELLFNKGRILYLPQLHPMQCSFIVIYSTIYQYTLYVVVNSWYYSHSHWSPERPLRRPFPQLQQRRTIFCLLTERALRRPFPAIPNKYKYISLIIMYSQITIMEVFKKTGTLRILTYCQVIS